MPTKTFLRLPLEKQKVLIEAAEREFSRVDYATASINQIIQDANIPRGSFYMYFQDKEDLYFYLVKGYVQKMFQRISLLLDSHHGDFIASFEELREEIIDFCFDPQKGQFLRRIFLNLRHTTERKVFAPPQEPFFKKDLDQILAKTEKNLYHYSSQEMLLDSLAMVMLITTNSIVCTMMNPEMREEEKNNYKRRIEIIRYGILRKEKIYV